MPDTSDTALLFLDRGLVRADDDVVADADVAGQVDDAADVALRRCHEPDRQLPRRGRLQGAVLVLDGAGLALFAVSGWGVSE